MQQRHFAEVTCAHAVSVQLIQGWKQCRKMLAVSVTFIRNLEALQVDDARAESVVHVEK